MSGTLIITAPEADAKSVNRLLLYLRDWEFEPGDCFKLITTKSTNPSDISETATPPVTDFDNHNEFAGASVSDIESWLLSHNESLAVIVDSQGFKDKTCILMEQGVDYDPPEGSTDNGIKMLDTFNKMRLPWDVTYITWCNLNIANMNWDEFCDDQGDTGEGWWVYQPIPPHPMPDVAARNEESSKEIDRQRGAAVKALQDLGHA